MALELIVFLPLLAALVAGLGGPWIGKTAAKVVTTGALFVGAALSWPIFFQYVLDAPHSSVIPVMEWIASGPVAIESIAWSPDGTSVAYSTLPDERMYVATIDGSSKTALGPGRQPDWSPDGTRIAYASPDRCQIWTMSPEGICRPDPLTRPCRREKNPG